MERRYVIALVLMIVIMIGWSYWYGKKFPQPERPQPKEQTTRPETQEPVEVSEPSAPSGEATTVSSQRVQESRKIRVETANYEVVFAEELAIAQEWILKGYKERSRGEGVAINLIPEAAQNCLAIRFFEPNLQIDALDAVWQADNEALTLTRENPQGSLTFTAQIGERLKVSKTFTFHYDTYVVDLDVSLENAADEPFTALETDVDGYSGYKLRWGPGINADLLPHELKSGKRERHNPKGEGATAYTGFGKPSKVLGDAHLAGTVLWAGVHDKYFAALMIPSPQLQAQYQYETLQDNGVSPPLDVTAPSEAAALVIPGTALDANQTRRDTFRLYVGPKKADVLNAITAPENPEVELRLNRIIDFGFFWPIAWALLWILNGLHAIIRNYGVAIILLTLLTKLVSYPLTRKSYKSMKEMQKLQPLLTELREKYRDDPQRLNKATMQLYKEHGVNPLGGCLPWLPQIPIFWALFSILGNAVELRGAPFFLWMDDLAAPDTIAVLPVSIPLIVTQIDAIRILPIVNGVTTWLQQKMTGGMTPTTDNTQAKIMQFMPLLFVFLFYNWASGFVLYWLCNNVFTIGQQYLSQMQEAKAPATAAKPSVVEKKPQPKKSAPAKVKRKA